MIPVQRRAPRNLRLAYRGCALVQLRHDPTYWCATQRLPRTMRPAVHALYAYVRTADELVDAPSTAADPAARRDALDAWQAALERARDGGRADSSIIAALVDAGARHDLPLDELRLYMDAMRVDCGPVRIADHGELDRYMRGSAGAVGIIMAQLLDASPDALAQMGTAFQLTNFIRDVAQDWTLDRIYLPGIDADDLAAASAAAAPTGLAQARVRARIADEVARARALFAATAGVVTGLHPRLRPGVRLARAVYLAVLDRIERRDFDVLGGRAALTPTDIARAIVAR